MLPTDTLSPAAEARPGALLLELWRRAVEVGRVRVVEAAVQT